MSITEQLQLSLDIYLQKNINIMRLISTTIDYHKITETLRDGLSSSHVCIAFTVGIGSILSSSIHIYTEKCFIFDIYARTFHTF